MELDEIFTRLFDQQEEVLLNLERKDVIQREIYDSLSYDNYITGIVGLRGVGKTTWMLQEVIKNGGKSRKVLYISADNILLERVSLIELVEYAIKNTQITKLYIDEIHKYQNWAQELKNISDLYSQFRIIFTGSSSIDIVRAKYDLSRRVTLINLYGLSFREYLYFDSGIELPVYSLKEIISKPVEINNDFVKKVRQPLVEMTKYKELGYYPFFRQFRFVDEALQAVKHSIEKTIYEDIGTIFLYKSQNLLTIERLLNFIINSSVGELNITKLAGNLGKDFDTTSNYLQSLQQAGLVIGVYNSKTGDRFLRNPEKVFPANTVMMNAKKVPMDDDAGRGKFREVFALSHLKAIGSEIRHTSHGDFAVDGKYLLEIRGRNKSTRQVYQPTLSSKKEGYVFADGLTSPNLSGKVIPLYLLGLLY